MKTKDIPQDERGDFYVRSGPGTVRLSAEDTEQYIQTRFPKMPATSKNTE
jgi:hypothetical protein